MKSWLDWIVAAIVWGVLTGTGVGLVGVLGEGYLPLGLFLLSSRTVLDAIWVYTGLTVLGGVAAGPAWGLVRVVAPRFGLSPTPYRRLLFAGFVSLPIWAGVALHDRALLPEGGRAAIAVLSLLVAVHLAGLLGWHRVTRSGATPRPGRTRMAAVLCIASVLLVSGVRWGLPWVRGVSDRPNLLLVVLDTVRADRLSSYGYPRATTPEIDEFASDAIRFTDFYSTSSWTLPSHASLFTGLFPAAHGATQALGRQHTTLAELLFEEGFQTWGASANPYVGRATNLAQGFEHFRRTWSHKGNVVAGPHRAVTEFESFLAGSDRERPFFAFVNLMEAHAPYTPPPDLRRRFLGGRAGAREVDRVVRKEWMEQYSEDGFSERELRVLSDLYDGGVAHASRIFGELLEALRRDGRFERTWVVVTSDHGEHFGENGRVAHMFTLYNTAVHVPLIVRPPGGNGGARTDARPGQLVDLFPALLTALGVERAGPPHHGRDLLAPDFERHAILSEYDYPSRVMALLPPTDLERNRDRLDPHQRALQEGESRFIWSSDGGHELYDLARDPGETHNLYDPEAPTPLAHELLARIEELAQKYARTDAGSSGPAPLDAETEEALRALGYVR